MKYLKYSENIDWKEDWDEEEEPNNDMPIKIRQLHKLLNDSELENYIIKKAVEDINMKYGKESYWTDLYPLDCTLDFDDFIIKNDKLEVKIIDNDGDKFWGEIDI